MNAADEQPNNESVITDVIEPMIVALEVERKFLNMDFPTWRFEQQDLEIIKPLHGSIPKRNWHSYEKFVADEGAMEIVTRHDEAVENLRSACSELQKTLEENPKLEELYNQFASDENLERMGVTREALFGARGVERHTAWLAQLIVNTTPDLKPIYTIHPLWNAHKTEFLALLYLPDIRPVFDRMQRAQNYLLQAIAETREYLIARQHKPD